MVGLRRTGLARRGGLRLAVAGSLLLLFEGGHVDDVAEADFAVFDLFIGVVDVLDVEHLDVGGDVVLGAEVEDLLGFGDAADEGAADGEAMGGEDHVVEGGERLEGADDDEGAVAFEKGDEGGEVGLLGDGGEEEVEGGGEGIFGVGLGGEVVGEVAGGAEAFRFLELLLVVVKRTTSAPMARASFAAMSPRPPKPMMPTL